MAFYRDSKLPQEGLSCGNGIAQIIIRCRILRHRYILPEV